YAAFAIAPAATAVRSSFFSMLALLVPGHSGVFRCKTLPLTRANDPGRSGAGRGQFPDAGPPLFRKRGGAGNLDAGRRDGFVDPGSVAVRAVDFVHGIARQLMLLAVEHD